MRHISSQRRQVIIKSSLTAFSIFLSRSKLEISPACTEVEIHPVSVEDAEVEIHSVPKMSIFDRVAPIKLAAALPIVFDRAKQLENASNYDYMHMCTHASIITSTNLTIFRKKSPNWYSVFIFQTRDSKTIEISLFEYRDIDIRARAEYVLKLHRSNLERKRLCFDRNLFCTFPN